MFYLSATKKVVDGINSSDLVAFVANIIGSKYIKKTILKQVISGKSLRFYVLYSLFKHFTDSDP